jgi:nucleolar protein 53
LWGNEDETQDDTTTTTVKRMAGVAPPHLSTKAARAVPTRKQQAVAVDVAQSGQSYHPDPTHHQNVIGEALALELRRQEAQDYRDAPISTGMSEETKALLLGDSDDETSSDEDDDTTLTSTATVLHKQRQKLTRAQRNRQKRIRAEEKAMQERKIAKKRLNAIAEAKTLSKQLEKQERLNKARKAELASIKQQQARTLGTSVVQQVSERNPLHAPTLPVALSDEISGSLRTMKPKGSLLSDRMESFRDRNMATTKLVGDKKLIVQGNKRRKLKVKAKKGLDIHVKDEETGKDYLLMG